MALILTECSDSNAVSNPAAVSCPRSVRIVDPTERISNMTIPTTTYTPPTGVPGMTGAIGPIVNYYVLLINNRPK